jgi:hypothetical protein
MTGEKRLPDGYDIPIPSNGIFANARSDKAVPPTNNKFLYSRHGIFGGDD